MYNIYCASYKRSDICRTHKYLPSITYVVSEDEADEYKKVHDKIMVVPNEVQGNLARVWNYILDKAPTDHVITIDDDIKYFGRWNCNVQEKLNSDQVHNMIQEGIQLAIDLDVRYWGLNCLADKGAYREYTPFGMTSYIGGPFQAHNKNPLRYDEEIYLKEDYDMSIQVLNKFRKNLRLNMYHYICEQATIKGGCADYRNVEREQIQNNLLQKKWGSTIVRFDKSNKSKKEKNFDINPIINVPITGV
tara:strand:- start:16544 stop:17284 length:741 start_codon:yes stop_codon:yes gene_type:complete